MEQVFFRTNVRIASTFCTLISPAVRSMITVVSLINAGLTILLLYSLHTNFIPGHGGIEVGDSCLSRLVKSSAHTNADIWNIELVTRDFNNLRSQSIMVAENEFSCGSITIDDLFNDYLRGQMSTFQDDEGGLFGSANMLSASESLPMPKSHFVANVTCKESDAATVTGYKRLLLQQPLSSILVDQAAAKHAPELTLYQFFAAQRVYLYSKHRSMLMMRTEQMLKHHVSIATVNIEQGSEECFGSNDMLKNVLHKYIGYHAVMRSWVLDAFHYHGYLYNIMEKDLARLSNFQVGDAPTFNQSPWPVITVGNLVLTVFLYYVAASVISLTLKLTQENMLKFAYLLTHYVRLRIPYFNLVTTHILGSFVFVPIMIGLQYFMVEFYHTHTLSFSIITLVWMGEIYNVLCVRTWTSKILFPKFTMLYFWAFNLYCENYGYGFTMVALTATLLFCIHIMFVFYYECEVPAMENGSVNALSPRQWIQIEMYENVAKGENEPSSQKGSANATGNYGEETIWHTGGVPRRREPIHNNTRIAGGVSTSTIVVGHSSDATKRVPLLPPPGIKLHYDGRDSHSDSSGFVRNLALSRRIQYEQMSSVLGHSVMESSGMATIYYKSAPSAAVAATEAAAHPDENHELEKDQASAWLHDVLATVGLEWGVERPRRTSLDFASGSPTKASQKNDKEIAEQDEDDNEVHVNGRRGGKKTPARPKTGISPYDLTGYVPIAKSGNSASKPNPAQRGAAAAAAATILNRSPERPFPPREPVPSVSVNDGPSPVSTRSQAKKKSPNPSSNDFGYKKSDFRVFGDLE